jgi:hypothetical protein
MLEMAKRLQLQVRKMFQVDEEGDGDGAFWDSQEQRQRPRIILGGRWPFDDGKGNGREHLRLERTPAGGPCGHWGLCEISGSERP